MELVLIIIPAVINILVTGNTEFKQEKVFLLMQMVLFIAVIIKMEYIMGVVDLLTPMEQNIKVIYRTMLRLEYMLLIIMY